MNKTPNKLAWLAEQIESLKENGLLINVRIIDSPMGPRIKVDGKWVLNFCSNNYLGLANDINLKTSAKKAIDRMGIGPTAVRTIAGTTTLHVELENLLAEFKKVDSVILLQSGFTANLATIPAMVGEGDVIFSDELNHASIIDACRLSRAEVVRYNHRDTKDLEKKITAYKDRPRKLIVTDGVFSMDGDIAPLPEIVKIAERHKAIIMVDDAHGEGVLGKNGRGIVDHYNLHGKIDIEVGTLSKAFGVVGGFVAGRKIIVDWRKQRARPYLFSSARTIPDVAACIEGVKLLKKSGKLVKKLMRNSNYFKSNLVKLGFDIGHSQTPIVPVMLGDVKLAKEFSRLILDKGIFAMAIGYPTVPQGQARIRVMMSASHSRKDLDSALKSFEVVGRQLKVLP